MMHQIKKTMFKNFPEFCLPGRVSSEVVFLPARLLRFLWEPELMKCLSSIDQSNQSDFICTALFIQTMKHKVLYRKRCRASHEFEMRKQAEKAKQIN